MAITATNLIPKITNSNQKSTNHNKKIIVGQSILAKYPFYDIIKKHYKQKRQTMITEQYCPETITREDLEETLASETNMIPYEENLMQDTLAIRREVRRKIETPEHSYTLANFGETLGNPVEPTITEQIAKFERSLSASPTIKPIELKRETLENNYELPSFDKIQPTEDIPIIVEGYTTEQSIPKEDLSVYSTNQERGKKRPVDNSVYTYGGQVHNKKGSLGELWQRQDEMEKEEARARAEHTVDWSSGPRPRDTQEKPDTSRYNPLEALTLDSFREVEDRNIEGIKALQEKFRILKNNQDKRIAKANNN